MNDLLNRLAEDHRRLTRLMTMLEGLLDQFHGGGEPNYGLIAELMEYIVDFADQVHHPSEDLIFARVVERTDAGGEVLRQLLRQHEGMAQVNRRFRDAVEGVMNEVVVAREDLEQQGRAVIALQREHMRLEDEQGFPLALATLAAEDWAELDARAPRVEDPIFGHADRERFRTLYLYLKAESGA